MPNRRDTIAVVEACYDLAASESTWLKRIADAAFPLVNPTGLLAYHVDVDHLGPRFRDPVEAGDGKEALERIRAMADLLERKRAGTTTWLESLQARIYSRVVRGGMREPASVMLISEAKNLGPKWMYTLGVPGVVEVFHLRSHHIDGNGITMLVGGLAEERKVRPAEREMFMMLSAHIKAGLRLRRRRPQLARVDAPEGGAVLDASAKVVHAEGEAGECTAREMLQTMARRIDRARTEQAGRDEAALGVWQGLIDGRWSLVEQFDSDGKRFMLAHKNPENVLDPRGLTQMEARVVALAARGYSNKLVGYHLGVTEGTVSSHLARAMTKLNVGSRVELVRILGGAHDSRTQKARDDEEA